MARGYDRATDRRLDQGLAPSIRTPEQMNDLLPYPEEFPDLPQATAWGWTDDRCIQYLHPDGYLTAPGVPLLCRPLNLKSKHRSIVPYTRPKIAGTWEGWLEAAEIASEYPHAYSALYCSIASLLLPILEQDNFGMELCSMTSLGKTTSIRFAMSVWGDPEELHHNWGGTTSYLPAQSTQGATPRAKDEAHLARVKTLSEWVYNCSSGSYNKYTWRSTFLAAGEIPAGERTKLPGIYARVVSLRGPPFGHDPDTGGEAAEEVTQICRHHYGHLSIRIASYLVEYHERLYPALRASYLGRFNDLLRRESSGAFRRHARYIAAMHVAADLAQSLGLPTPRSILSPEDLLYRSAIDCSGCADQARRSFVHLCLFIRSKKHRFVPNTLRGYASNSALRADYPIKYFGGIWDHQNPNWETIAVTRGFLHNNKEEYTTWSTRYTDNWEARGYVLSGTGRYMKAAKENASSKDKYAQFSRTFAVSTDPRIHLSGFFIPREQYERALQEAPTLHPVLSAQYPG